MVHKWITLLRRDYHAVRGMHESDLDPDPMVQFGKWFHLAVKSRLPEPTALTLSTVSLEGNPSGRIVLLKEHNPQGFIFFTNYDSRKGREIAANPRVTLTFLWMELARQVVIEGVAEKISHAESEEYFQTRPQGSRRGAWASRQSEVLENREALERRMKEVVDRFRGETIPCPPHWGGYLVRPVSVEFWQGRANRLHDRLRYRKTDGAWKIERLSP